MQGILLVDKPINLTSRDVVNEVSKILNIKKIGHTGTLDPMATGVLVLCVGNYTKLASLLTSLDKEYVATVQLGIQTDTLDITGQILKEEAPKLPEEKLRQTLTKQIGEYLQEVPIYSAVKVKGKKLYEYARNNEAVELPQRKVCIKEIELLAYVPNKSFTFRCLVSKGTYIRSLIRDLTKAMGVLGVMSALRRTKQGEFSIEDTYTLEQIKKQNFTYMKDRLLFKDYFKVEVSNELKQKIENGQILDNIYNQDNIVFMYNNHIIALYQRYDKDKTKIKPYKML